MPIIPKLNLKAAVRINDAPLNLSMAYARPSTSAETAEDNRGGESDSPERIVIESQPSDVKHSPSGDELSPPAPAPPPDDMEYEEDDGESDFKSPPPSIINSHQFQMELHEGGDSPHSFHRSPKEEQSESHDPIGSRRLAELVHPDHLDGASVQSYSDAESIGEHSVQSDTSYTKEALQITQQQQQAKSNQFTSLKQSPSNASTIVTPPRKRRRATNKLTQDPAVLPLCDLLFYNPPPTIFQSKAQEDLNNNSEENMKKPGLPAKKLRTSRSSSVASNRSRRGSLDFDDEALKSGDENSEKDLPNNNGAANDEPVLMLDECGNIVIKNPNSLADDKDKKPEAKMKSSTTYNSFRRRERTKNVWNTEETSMFYTALEMVGTDFSLMEAVFFKDRGRSRKQLKQKFKREEKINRDYIDSILYKSLHNRSKLSSHLIRTAAADGDALGQAMVGTEEDVSAVTSSAGSGHVDTNVVLQTA